VSCRCLRFPRREKKKKKETKGEKKARQRAEAEAAAKAEEEAKVEAAAAAAAMEVAAAAAAPPCPPGWSVGRYTLKRRSRSRGCACREVEWVKSSRAASFSSLHSIRFPFCACSHCTINTAFATQQRPGDKSPMIVLSR
jgi:hypothetical protein